MTTWRFHPERDRLLAEAHARPSTPVSAPLLATRIATMSGEGGGEVDRAHMAALCRKIGAAEPGPGARWCVLDGGRWSLRWERHTEVSTWTVFRPGAEAENAGFTATALDIVPQDWLASLPGEVLAAAHVSIVSADRPALPFTDAETIATRVANGEIDVFTDFRAGPDSFTRFVMIQRGAAAATAGRILQQLFEIETYRLLALLAFPLAGSTSVHLAKLEADAAAAAAHVAEEGGVDADRALLSRLAALAGEAETLVGATGFRFAAARAYHGLVQERIGQLHETAIEGRPTIAEFMERRLAPAMRTCNAVAERQRDVIERIARTTQMLNTRVEVAAEATNVGLLASMDRRAQQQLRLQQTVEGLSVAAIAYYALGLLKFVIEAMAEVFPGINPILATGLAAPLVIFGVWHVLKRIRAHLAGGPAS
ncbi:MAG: DUF3422 domain-containing protein [Hyphomonadaceae bacterium]|nr:DUF3422 domain-containing protein [Hyphomonadaceae bacterium]